MLCTTVFTTYLYMYIRTALQMEKAIAFEKLFQYLVIFTIIFTTIFTSYPDNVFYNYFYHLSTYIHTYSPPDGEGHCIREIISISICRCTNEYLHARTNSCLLKQSVWERMSEREREWERRTHVYIHQLHAEVISIAICRCTHKYLHVRTNSACWRRAREREEVKRREQEREGHTRTYIKLHAENDLNRHM